VRERVGALVDATHPYASVISANAAAAAGSARVPLIALRRPPWHKIDGDRWTPVNDVNAAVEALGKAPRRVFVALGRNELAPFSEAPQHYYLIRSVDPVVLPLALPQADYITGRGPFSEAADRALLKAHRIEAVVAKNSGGTATYGKIAAARALGLEVIILRRPALPAAPAVATVDEAVIWLDQALTLAAARGV
jgi:precorrin-6A/cobalt-precorrin-6A reductase